MRQQKLTSLESSLFAERQIVNCCSGFSGCRNLTVRIAASSYSFCQSCNAARTSSRITTPGTTGASGKCPGKLGCSAVIARRTSKVMSAKFSACQQFQQLKQRFLQECGLIVTQCA